MAVGVVLMPPSLLLLLLLPYFSLCIRFIVVDPCSWIMLKHFFPFLPAFDLTLQGNIAAEIRPGVCLHASCLIRCTVRFVLFFLFFFFFLFFWSVLLENLKWKRTQSKSGEQRKKKLQFLYWSFAGAQQQQQQQQQWEQKKKRKGHGSNTFIWMNFLKDNVVFSFLLASLGLSDFPILMGFFFRSWCDATHPMLNLCTYTQLHTVTHKHNAYGRVQRHKRTLPSLISTQTFYFLSK